MSDIEHRGRISFVEYSEHLRASKRARLALVCAVIVFALLFIGLVVFGVSLVDDSQKGMVKTAAQDDEALLQQEKQDEQLTKASSEAVNLVALMGLTKKEALAQIQRGAMVEAQSSIDDHGLKKELSLSLTDEKGNELSGTPSATIKLTEEGKVGAASYSAPLDALGYGNISFTDAVTKYHVIDNVLTAVGITAYSRSSLSLPGRSAYSDYESDGKTLKAETYTFSGNSQQEEGSFNWTATLHYDYAEANKTGNLANTIRKITVSVRRAYL